MESDDRAGWAKEVSIVHTRSRVTDRLAALCPSAHPDACETVDLAGGMADEIHTLMDRHGVDEIRRSDVPARLAFLFTWSDGA